MIEMDCIMKHNISGHERGVNWTVFHPTFNLIASISFLPEVNEVNALKEGAAFEEF